MNRLIVIVIALLAVAAGMASAADELSWRVLETQFRDMPIEAKRLTCPLFWLHGDSKNEPKSKIETYIRRVAEGHNGSFCAESRPHSDWLGPKWFGDLEVCLQAAKMNNLKMWIFDEKWWPSQTVAGKVPALYAAKTLQAEAVEAEGLTRVKGEGYGGEHFITAIAGKITPDGIDPESLVDLRPFIKDGKLSWVSDAGKWQVMKFTWGLAPNARQGSQATVDGASKDCVDWFINTVYKPHYDRFSYEFGNTIRGFFYDEPETQGDWGTELSKIFAERKVDEMKALVAWKFKLAGEQQTAARYAYIDAFAEAWGRTMYGGLLKWCNDHQVDLIGHFIEHDGWYFKPGHGAIDLFKMQKYNTMGGMDLVCQQLWPGERNFGIYQLPKLTSSISHAYGKKDDLAMTEIFGAYGQGITYPQMKWLCDWHQVRGVNFMVPHSFNPLATTDTDCPPYFYAEGLEPRWPLYRVWADYSSRLSMMLTGGKHVCPVAILFCGSSAYVGKVETPEKMTTTLQDALYDCDWIPYEVFDEDMSFNGKELTLRDERYRVLVIPPVETISYDVLVKAKGFFDTGGIVVGYNFLPSKSADLGRTSAEIASIVDAIWGSREPGLAVKKTNPAGGRSYFLPDEITPEQINQVLAGDAGAKPVVEVLEGSTDNWLHVLHRVKSGRDVYFICNQQHEGEAKRFRLRVATNGVPERWDPMRNEITGTPYTLDKGGVQFDLTLEPMESALIVMNPDPEVSLPMAVTPNTKPKSVIPVDGNKPKPADYGLLNSQWVWYPDGDPKVNAAPGTRWFRKEITVPDTAIKQGRFLISADNEWVLYVNGEKVGENNAGDNAWARPKELRIEKLLKPGVNVLAIAATNTTDKPSPAGLIGRYSIEFSDGKLMREAIDDSWKTSDREAEGWTAAGFDDTKWPAAKVIAKFGDQPWGKVGLFLRPANSFKGTCTIPENLPLNRARVYLEMENVEEGGAVMVNGQYLGGFVGRPFRYDVTRYLKAGQNSFDISPYAPESVRLAVY